MKIPIRNTTDPPTSRLLRRVDPIFVDALMGKMVSDPVGPGIPPLAVVCTSEDEKDKFKEHLKEVYKYVKCMEALTAEQHD